MSLNFIQNLVLFFMDFDLSQSQSYKVDLILLEQIN